MVTHHENELDSRTRWQGQVGTHQAPFVCHLVWQHKDLIRKMALVSSVTTSEQHKEQRTRKPHTIGVTVPHWVGLKLILQVVWGTRGDLCSLLNQRVAFIYILWFQGYAFSKWLLAVTWGNEQPLELNNVENLHQTASWTFVPRWSA